MGSTLSACRSSRMKEHIISLYGIRTYIHNVISIRLLLSIYRAVTCCIFLYNLQWLMYYDVFGLQYFSFIFIIDLIIGLLINLIVNRENRWDCASFVVRPICVNVRYCVIWCNFFFFATHWCILILMPPSWLQII